MYNYTFATKQVAYYNILSIYGCSTDMCRMQNKSSHSILSVENENKLGLFDPMRYSSLVCVSVHTFFGDK